MLELIKELNYYIFASNRRKMIDKALQKYSNYFQGKVLDIGGGRVSGKFALPKVKQWLVVDIEKKSKPNLVASVENLPFRKNSFDTIKATELFEHVENLERGFSECARVLKKRGHIIISSPFMFPIHGDPSDYQRITSQKWEKIARENKLRVKVLEEQGYFFTLVSELWRTLITNIALVPLRYLLYITFPLFDFLATIDNTRFVKSSKNFNRFVGGYFIIVYK